MCAGDWIWVVWGALGAGGGCRWLGVPCSLWGRAVTVPPWQLNPNVSAFQRRFVGEVRRCEEMEKTFTFLQQELRGAGRVLGPCPESPRAPLAREALRVQEQSEQLAQELREVSHNRASLRGRLRELRQYLHPHLCAPHHHR
uniref:V-type proton ATPase subunit a n=1 Tax=Falco tinnunculus TaxID=100819 RepID=A0A8C4UD32_FALTI